MADGRSDWFLMVCLFAAAERRDGDDTRVDAGQQCPGGQGAAGPEAPEQEGGRHQEVACHPTINTLMRLEIFFFFNRLLTI
jgi:hypothetical protein